MARALLYIGASSANDLEHLLGDRYDQVLIAAATPTAAKELECLKETFPALTVRTAAVVSDSTANIWYEYNLPEFSGIHKPSGLKNLYAGLRVVDSYEVNTLSPEELFQLAPLPEGVDHTLVINEKGEEVAILRQLIENNLLEGFSKILLAARERPYYENEYTIDTVLEDLNTLHFELARKPAKTSEWPIWQFERNPLKPEVEGLKIELERAQRERKTVTDELAAHNAQFNQKLEHLEKALSERTEYAEQHKHWHYENKQWAETLKKQKEAAEQELNEAKSVLNVRNQELEALEKKISEVNAELASKKRTTQEIEQQLNVSEGEREEQVAKLNEKIEHLEKSLAQEHTRVAGLERTNNMQTKLLTKMEVDSQDLRRRYADLQVRERELTDLIKELHGKLELASGFFRQLQNEHPELLDQY